MGSAIQKPWFVVLGLLAALVVFAVIIWFFVDAGKTGPSLINSVITALNDILKGSPSWLK